MHIIYARNVNDAYVQGVTHLLTHYATVQTRSGPARVCTLPVTTHYRRPDERVLLDVDRDANPVFHLLEALWMLDGRNDVTLMRYLVPGMVNYAETNAMGFPTHFHGAYGYRWRKHFSRVDQLEEVVSLLKKNGRDRRVMLQMWDATVDLNADRRDIPCNVMIKFATDPAMASVLNMMVFCRSNDAVLGCYGANAVHLSILHEYVAARTKLRTGWYQQISCDFHLYEAQWRKTGTPAGRPCPYREGLLVPTPIVTDEVCFDEELADVMHELTTSPTHTLDPDRSYANPLFPDVVRPMMNAYRAYRNGELAEAVHVTTRALAQPGYATCDWLVATNLWMSRRLLARRQGTEAQT